MGKCGVMLWTKFQNHWTAVVNQWDISITHWPLGDLRENLDKSNCHFHGYRGDWWLRYLLWNCSQINVTGPYYSLRESILRLFYWGRTTVTTRCAQACSQALPVKPQRVWARGIEAWARSRDRRNLEFWRWVSSGPSNLMSSTLEKLTLVPVMAWCRHAARHYLNQCWPWSVSPYPYGVTRPHWVNMDFEGISNTMYKQVCNLHDTISVTECST